jgi:hypothetical protein
MKTLKNFLASIILSLLLTGAMFISADTYAGKGEEPVKTKVENASLSSSEVLNNMLSEVEVKFLDKKMNVLFKKKLKNAEAISTDRTISKYLKKSSFIMESNNTYLYIMN